MPHKSGSLGKRSIHPAKDARLRDIRGAAVGRIGYLISLRNYMYLWCKPQCSESTTKVSFLSLPWFSRPPQKLGRLSSFQFRTVVTTFQIHRFCALVGLPLARYLVDDCRENCLATAKTTYKPGQEPGPQSQDDEEERSS